jgi:hypothetical protein
MKSVEYALNPPLVVMTNNNIEVINPSSVRKKKICSESPSFKEISNMQMTDLQKNTMKILVEEDKKIEKLRGAKVDITMDEVGNKSNFHNTPSNPNNIKNNKNLIKHNSSNNKNSKFEVNNLMNNAVSSSSNSEKLQNPNANASPFTTDGPIDLNLDFQMFGFLETKSTTRLTEGNTKFTKPISVKMKLPGEPDASIKKEIENIEGKRSSFESNMFEKAKQEFKLITALTISELQKHLNHEMLPFFVISKNALTGISNVISSSIPSGGPSQSRFIQLDHSELTEKFPNLELANDQEALNKYVYSKILNIFSENPELYTDSAFLKKKDKKSKDDKENLNEEEENNNPEDDSQNPDIFSTIMNFNYQKCLEMARKLKHLDCDQKLQDYLTLKNHLRTSFLQQEGGDDLINVKFSANDDPYPTIEKIFAQMMTRRDLAEKFERLKILEFETHLQKAENEMIQDMLHERIYKIMALYGPAVEGIKEHIR